MVDYLKKDGSYDAFEINRDKSSKLSMFRTADRKRSENAHLSTTIQRHSGRKPFRLIETGSKRMQLFSVGKSEVKSRRNASISPKKPAQELQRLHTVYFPYLSSFQGMSAFHKPSSHPTFAGASWKALVTSSTNNAGREIVCVYMTYRFLRT